MARELLQILAKRQPGDEVKLGVLRDRQTLEIDGHTEAPQRTFRTTITNH